MRVLRARPSPSLASPASPSCFAPAARSLARPTSRVAWQRRTREKESSREASSVRSRCSCYPIVRTWDHLMRNSSRIAVIGVTIGLLNERVENFFLLTVRTKDFSTKLISSDCIPVCCGHGFVCLSGGLIPLIGGDPIEDWAIAKFPANFIRLRLEHEFYIFAAELLEKARCLVLASSGPLCERA